MCMCMYEGERNLPWSLNLSPTSSLAFCRLSTISVYSLRTFSARNKVKINFTAMV